VSYRHLCHLHAGCLAWATVPPRAHFSRVSLTATSVAMMARTAAADAIGVRSRRRASVRSRCPLGCDLLAATLPGRRLGELPAAWSLRVFATCCPSLG
jgi:hypothetical protein